MKNYIFKILVLMMLLASCSKEPQMGPTVFIPDTTDSNLPAYTEYGYNTFGSIWDKRSYFLANSSIAPCEILFKDGILKFSLFGILRGSGYYYGEQEIIALSISFPGENVTQYSDLLTLHNKKINLKDADCMVTIIRDENDQVLNIIDGFLHFQRAQLIYIDEAPNRVILSGTFELHFPENEFPTLISYGRFDVGINNNVFYAY
jgi:hypothetical protein